MVIITAHDEPGSRERCIAAGASAYLRKPVESNVLIAIINKLTVVTPNNANDNHSSH